MDPSATEPVGNSSLTFDIVYQKVLRTYYLLYPIMNRFIPLNNEQAMSAHASMILQRTELSLWMSNAYMPKTRDMSESRRTLLRAWCRKVLSTTSKKVSKKPSKKGRLLRPTHPSK